MMLKFVLLGQSNTGSYVRESNENIKSVIKILNTARLSGKVTTVILVV